MNGTPAEILRANHVFRVVQVPAGHSEVEFRYRSRSLYIGALVSSLTAALLLFGAARTALHRRRPGVDDSAEQERLEAASEGQGRVATKSRPATRNEYLSPQDIQPYVAKETGEKTIDEDTATELCQARILRRG